MEEVGTDGLVLAKGLYKENDYCSWNFFFVKDYDEKEKKFHGIWAHNNQEGKLSRIYMCFDEENTRNFAKRIEAALLKRKYADSIIRYNFFINEMPKQDVNELDETQKARLAKKSQKRQNRDLKFDLASLFHEINEDYAHIMNRLVFDKYIGEASKDVLPHDLVLPPTQEEALKYFGLIELNRNKDSKIFIDSFKDFSATTFIQKEEAIRVLELIKQENKLTLEMSIFNTNIPKPLKIEEFLSQQESSTNSVVYNLKGSWVARVVSIIKTEFIGVGRGWASVPELRKGTYEYDKFIRFIQLVKEQMQDTIYTMTNTNFECFLETIKAFVPSETLVKSCNEVENIFSNHKYTTGGKLIHQHPLFIIDILKHYKEEGMFQFSVPPDRFTRVTIQLFERTLADLGRVNDIEPKILSESDKVGERYLRAPKMPESAPEDVLQGKGKWRQVIDENKWLWDMREELKKLLEKGIKPLTEYMVCFDKYKDLLGLDPEKLIKDLEEEDPPKSEEALRDEVYKYIKMEDDIRKQIPKDKHVSYFLVNNNEIIELFAGKF